MYFHHEDFLSPSRSCTKIQASKFSRHREEKYALSCTFIAILQSSIIQQITLFIFYTLSSIASDPGVKPLTIGYK